MHAIRLGFAFINFYKTRVASETRTYVVTKLVFLKKKVNKFRVVYGVPHAEETCTGCIKKVDPFKFKLSIAYCVILNALIASNYNGA